MVPSKWLTQRTRLFPETRAGRLLSWKILTGLVVVSVAKLRVTVHEPDNRETEVQARRDADGGNNVDGRAVAGPARSQLEQIMEESKLKLDSEDAER